MMIKRLLCIIVEHDWGPVWFTGEAVHFTCSRCGGVWYEDPYSGHIGVSYAS